MNTETDFLQKTHEVFTGSIERLNASTLTRLREARARALAAAGTKAPVPLWRSRWALPAGAAAAVCAIIVASVLWLDFGSQPGVPFAAHSNEDMAIEFSGDNLDMYADMDFYRWLQVQQQDAPQAASDSNSNG